jgi:cell volume regulation protein A
MRVVEPEPWDVSIGLRAEPHGVQRYTVASGSRAEGRALADLPIGERSWISMIVRQNELVQAPGETTLEAGDELLLLADVGDSSGLRDLFGTTGTH